MKSKENPVTSDARHLGSLLLDEGLVTEDQLDKAMAAQEESGLPLGKVLVDEGLVAETDLVRTLARQIGIEFVDLDEQNVDPAATALIPDYLQVRFTALPIGFDDDGKLIVAMADPANVIAIDDMRAASGREISARVATRSALEDAIQRYSSYSESVTDLAEAAIADNDDATSLDDIEADSEEAPVVKLLNTVITRAIGERASDIHIEPGERDLRIRFRIDGVLHEVMTTPRTIANAVVSRVKIMADLNIAERRVPQDGRVSLKVGDRAIDLRVATLPSIYGEKVVMRILDKSGGVASLEDLGFLEHNLERYAESYTKPYGAILVTGPTGSGKTTTLYSTLDILNEPDVNIITVEDPVEYRLEGLTQVQVNRKAGLLFATALKSILRADPDIVLIGEIRDGETAKIAIEAALTGHLVLSTLHTNDAPSSINRLVDMDVEPFLVSSAIDAVLAQRLARRLCDKCKVSYKPTREELEGVRWDFERLDHPDIYRAEGCKSCSDTGYRGRVSINELMTVTEEIQRLTVERSSSDEMMKVAVEQGMLTLRDDGLEKVKLGYTSLEEVLRVVV
ncbi:MAG: Flp pilus assembly complex ATPase component TadA [Acidimicrobiia bacterium]|nr:Flp pilus assembly complex ATPase component TadA [Acidimicrobiia bacterium]NNC75426.1 Flp pilus assembly complex ATPase component TadA [Acidimicrobiia bacterium]